ncbi:type VI secretion system baseplate subunit TssK [Pseudoalteromonas sp. APC 3224]|uniref:type VI secretion system baseplate subunit TssK n=1 Tax=Pseudoalteromonas sp. APC 3224 TaxID=3035203 RepID=UPI0025B563CA|nr:type VI secretion system baseplate subunit TssK [Pseudoalteromonas sp. APC 3224]MDN3484453.1 type VI secretion system baseplate subunit TssK [Pseudoalteromonas sp. APC 3224]
MLNQLAAVDWCRGQTLLPEHLEAQELSLLTNSKLRFDSLGKPFFGVLQLSFDESDLMEGAIRLSAMSYLLESGELIELGGNAQLLTTKGLVVLPKDKNRADIRINIYTHKRSNGMDEANACFDDKSITAVDEVKKRFYYLELISFPSASSAESTDETLNLQLLAQVKIAEMFMDKQLNWILYEQFIPATVQVNRTPSFAPYIAKLRFYLDALEQEIEFGIASKPPIKHSVAANLQFQLLGELYSLSQLLDCLLDAQAKISVHPYDLFASLLHLYTLLKVYRNCQQLELDIQRQIKEPEQQEGEFEEPLYRPEINSKCALNGNEFSRPDWHRFKYRHEALGQTFFQLLDAFKCLIYKKSFSYQVVKLEEKDGIYSAPITVLNRANYYLAVWNEDQQILVTFEPPLKATSRAQVPIITLHNIPGVTFNRVLNKQTKERLDQALSPCMPSTYFAVDTTAGDNQWLQVKQDKNIGFYGQNEFRSSQFYIVVETCHNEING